ncbi:MAG TPA: enoyl-CoA hydratase/isomerase family protein [Acidobacteriota bacterium]
MKTFPSVNLNLRENIAYLQMHHGKCNILDFDLMKQLCDALDAAASSAVLVLSSVVGDFSKGVDIKIHTPDQVPEMLNQFHAVIRRLYHFSGVSICVLNGYALGGGFELALPCDLVAAEKEAHLGFPEIRLACFPPVAAVLLPQLIGRSANRLLFTGKMISADEGLALGLIDAVFEKDRQNELISEWTKTVSEYSPDALRILKRVALSSRGFDFDAALREAEECYLNDLLKSPDVAEGIEAFLQKRPAVYRRTPRE